MFNNDSHQSTAKPKPIVKLAMALISLMPNELIRRFINLFSDILYKKRNSRDIESFSYYGFSTFFMIDCIKEIRDFGKLSVLSVGCRVEQLIGILPLFDKCLHNTMIGMEDIGEIQRIESGTDLNEIVGDFFALNRSDILPFLPYNIDVVLSQATIHCMSDSRYNNSKSMDQWGGLERPYSFAKKLKLLIPNPQFAVIFSCAVSKEESLTDNSSWLNNQKLIDSFLAEGFTLKKHCFDKNQLVDTSCRGGTKAKSVPRISETLPLEYLESHDYVIGNYYFESK